MAVVPSTVLPSCVTGSPAILKGEFILLTLFDQNIFTINMLASKFTCWHSLFSFTSFAYIEFSDRDSVHSAIGLHETMFRGRVLKVRSIYTTC